MTDERRKQRLAQRGHTRKRTAALVELADKHRHDPDILELIVTLDTAGQIYGEARQAEHEAKAAADTARGQLNELLVGYLPEELQSPNPPVAD
jgi:hypothetical protein